MVSPQNPLKPAESMAAFDDRLAGARKFARHPAIRVVDIERRLGTRYTVHSLRAMKFCFPRMHFVWVMGADNLVEIARWRQWTKIFNLMPIAVFDRAPYSFGAIAGKAAQAFSRFKMKRKDAHELIETRPPAWMFFHTRLHPASATSIRARRQVGPPDGEDAGREAQPREGAQDR